MPGDAKPYELGNRPANPGGRPRKTDAMREAEQLAKEYSPKAIRRLIELTTCGDFKAEITACNSVLDRAFGKPVAAVALDVDVSGNIDVSGDVARLEVLRALERLGLRLAPAEPPPPAPALPPPPGFNRVPLDEPEEDAESDPIEAVDGAPGLTPIVPPKSAPGGR